MATETAAIPVNGTYTAVHTHGYEPSLVNHNTNVAPSTTPQASGSKDIPKDQVAWYFVEQYYTTMSRNPEKLPVRHTFLSIRNSSANECHSSSTTSDLSLSLASRMKRFLCVLGKQ